MIFLYNTKRDEDIYWPNFSGLFCAKKDLKSRKRDWVDVLIEDYVSIGEQYDIDDERLYFGKTQVTELSAFVKQLNDVQLAAYLMQQVAQNLTAAENCALGQSGVHLTLQQLGYHMHILLSAYYRGQLQASATCGDDTSFLHHATYHAEDARKFAARLRTCLN